MYWNLLVVILSLLHMAVFCENESLHREKRAYFVFPMGGQFKIVLAVAIPVNLGLKQSMTFAISFQFQYGAPTNISQLKNYPPTISDLTQKRVFSSNDRPIAYLGLELIMQRYGLNGRSCLLRTICENAMNSLHHEENGLYGHILHIFLTPSCGNETDTDLDPIYCEAQTAGEYGVDCNSLYPDCLYGQDILNMISFLDV